MGLPTLPWARDHKGTAWNKSTRPLVTRAAAQLSFSGNPVLEGYCHGSNDGLSEYGQWGSVVSTTSQLILAPPRPVSSLCCCEQTHGGGQTPPMVLTASPRRFPIKRKAVPRPPQSTPSSLRAPRRCSLRDSALMEGGGGSGLGQPQQRDGQKRGAFAVTPPCQLEHAASPCSPPREHTGTEPALPGAQVPHSKARSHYSGS